MTSEILLAYVTALALGAVHAFDIDHMVAVTSFVGSQPRLKTALMFGVRWGIGHSVALLLVGSVLVVTGVSMPSSWDVASERLVGVALVGVGLWLLWKALVQAPNQSHTKRIEGAVGRGRASTFVGLLHGMAGSATAVALVPVTMMSSTALAFGYLGAFGVGTVLAMGCYSGGAAMVASRVVRSEQTGRTAAAATAAVSVLVGLWWLVKA